MSDYSSMRGQTDYRTAKSIVAGVDVGAINSKAVIMLDGQPYASSQVATINPKESALRAINSALAKSSFKLENIHYIVGTGCGREQVTIANKTMTEITCSSAGALYIWGPTVRTVLDAGGQSCRIIHCTENGKVISFLWNDKCAAGIGRSIEIFADMVEKNIDKIGKIALQSDNFPKLSDFCVVYAQSEILDLMRTNVTMEQAIAAYHYAMAKRISTLAARSGIKKDFVVIGGLAKNPAITNWVERILKIQRLEPKPEWDPALITALGAALFANSFNNAKLHDNLTTKEFNNDFKKENMRNKI